MAMMYSEDQDPYQQQDDQQVDGVGNSGDFVNVQPDNIDDEEQ